MNRQPRLQQERVLVNSIYGHLSTNSELSAKMLLENLVLNYVGHNCLFGQICTKSQTDFIWKPAAGTSPVLVGLLPAVIW